MSASRVVVAVLLGAAAVGALVISADASSVGRFGGIVAAAILALVGAGVARSRRWAMGAAFFLGVCWLWATLALRLQGVMAGIDVAVWLTWSVAVMVGSVRARSA